MQIAVLVSAMSGTGHPLENYEKRRNPAMFDKNPENFYETVPLYKATAEKQIISLILKNRFDIYLNLCEGSLGDEVPGIEVVRCLQLYNVPYTGARGNFFTMSKRTMKLAAHSCNVSIPNHMFVYNEKDLAKFKTKIHLFNFPMIVKHYNGHDSVGLDKDCKVYNMDDLEQKIKSLMDRFGGALVEEFIEGPEYTVLVVSDENLEPRAYTPLQCAFENDGDFKYFDVKWRPAKFQYLWTNVDDEKMATKLKSAAEKLFTICNGSGYGRCDFRMDSKTQKIYFLEINANCSVFYEPNFFGSADEILNRDTKNGGHEGFLQKILKNAKRLHEMQQKHIRIDFTPQKGFFIVANRPFGTGELLDTDEMHSMCYVSRNYIQKQDREMKEVYNKYAFKISENVYRAWSSNPDDWAPINHSCDPNAWLDGLATVARRPIAEDEEITIDYGTYAIVDDDNKFECHCGAANCRKIIDPGQDFLRRDFYDTYGDHVSDYVKSLMEKNHQKKSATSNGHANNNPSTKNGH